MKGNRSYLTDLGNSTTCRTKQNQEKHKNAVRHYFFTKATEIEFFKAILEHAIGNKQKYYLRGDGRIFIIILKGYMRFK
ncbi:hypothetical protein EUGRSUZ_H02149 [Eucalyptus grandis]|uniref:Uncharacterized protein n=2 Tax=Eucalyptus grandis TaxID=71139 RepID=A0ACC3JQQ7_EUCGR|nr:hypothetical protein EUGRSUZ_H02149 [Eucalyptus grandis]